MQSETEVKVLFCLTAAQTKRRWDFDCPSPMTKPLLLVSQGLEAVVGSALQVGRAWHAQKT